MKTCVYCGCENNDDANFCKACGKPFEVVRETPEVQEEIQAEIPQYGEMLRSMPSLGEKEAKETLEEMNAGIAELQSINADLSMAALTSLPADADISGVENVIDSSIKLELPEEPAVEEVPETVEEPVPAPVAEEAPAVEEKAAAPEPVKEAPVKEAPLSVPAEPVKKKGNGILMLVVGLIVGCLIGALIGSQLNKAPVTTTNMLKDYEFSLTGGNGTGTLSVTGDPLTPALRALAAEDPAKAELINKLADSVSCTVSGAENGSLKNGDALLFACTYDQALAKQAGIAYENTSVTVQIEGLQ